MVSGVLTMHAPPSPSLQVGWAARSYGWRWGMWAPGAVGFTVGLLLLLGVRDSPEACGYKPVEVVERAKKVSQGFELKEQ